MGASIRKRLEHSRIVAGLLRVFAAKKWYVAGGILVFLLLILFLEQVKDLLIILGLGTVASYSTIYKKYIRMPPFLELMTFTTIIVSVLYGPIIGALYGAITSIMAEVINTCIDAFIIGYVPARATVGATAGWVHGIFPDMGIVGLGMSMTLLYNLVGQPLYMLQKDLELQAKAWTFIIGNIGFSFILYATLGRLLAPFFL